MKRIFSLVCGLCLFGAELAHAARPFLCCDYPGGKVCIVAADGRIEWEYPCQNPQDWWQ
ncbi:MAG: hypothetical protein HYZ36_03385, partial [Pedosphaera parvula]|nr:hypothetical protein [Pedosphaera parvula]